MSQSVLAFNANPTASTFNFGAHAVRIIIRDGEPWFSAADVCAALDVKNYRDAARHLDEDERGVVSTDTPARNQHGNIPGQFEQMLVVNESGLYALVLRSRKPEARKFAKWVTSEVLPSIRKTGGYRIPDQERISMAQHLASQAAAQVSQAVFNAVMAADADWQHSRYLLKLDDDGRGSTTAKARQIENGACVLPVDRFYSAIEDSFTVDAQTLTQLASICTARLGRMAQRAITT